MSPLAPLAPPLLLRLAFVTDDDQSAPSPLAAAAASTPGGTGSGSRQRKVSTTVAVPSAALAALSLGGSSGGGGGGGGGGSGGGGGGGGPPKLNGFLYEEMDYASTDSEEDLSLFEDALQQPPALPLPPPPPAQPPAPPAPPPPPRLTHPSDPRGFLQSIGIPDDQVDALLAAFPGNPLQAALEYSRQDQHGSVRPRRKEPNLEPASEAHPTSTFSDASQDSNLSPVPHPT